MDTKISCLVAADGRVYPEPEAGAGSGVATAVEVAENDCLRYEFDLAYRTLEKASGSATTPFAPGAAHELAVKRFFDDTVGTPERLIEFARKGTLPKGVLAALLAHEKRDLFLKACATIEKVITEACTAQLDPCLDDGCALEGDFCLQACLVAGRTYPEACAAAWIQLFENPANRIDAWKH